MTDLTDTTDPLRATNHHCNISTSLYYFRLRTKSMEPPITGTTFHKFDLPVPQELRDFCTDEKVKNLILESFHFNLLFY